MIRTGTRLRIAALLTALLPALAAAQESAPLLGAAADPVGLTNGGAGTHFSSPVPGARTSCYGTERQLWLLNPTVVVGEPVIMRLVVKAIDPAVKTDFLAQLSYGADLQVAIAPPTGQPYEFTGLKLGSNVPTAVVEMKDFDLFRIDFRFACDSESVSGAAFDIPGKYTIRFGLRCLAKDKEPEIIHLGDYTLNVVPATGDDATAMALLTNPSVFRAFQMRSSKMSERSLLTTTDVVQLNKLVATAPKAALRPHTLMVLADYESTQKNYDAALKLLRQLQDEYPNTPMADEAAFEELRQVLNHKSQAEAEQLFGKIWSHPARTQLVYPNSPMWKAFVEKRLPGPVGGQWMVQDVPGPDPELEGLTDRPRLLISPEVQEEWGLPAEMPSGELKL